MYMKILLHMKHNILQYNIANYHYVDHHKIVVKFSLKLLEKPLY